MELRRLQSAGELEGNAFAGGFDLFLGHAESLADPAHHLAHQHFGCGCPGCEARSEEHTSELQSLMRISYAVFCLKKKKKKHNQHKSTLHPTKTDTYTENTHQHT